jgi:hypothetical protein
MPSGQSPIPVTHLMLGDRCVRPVCRSGSMSFDRDEDYQMMRQYRMPKLIHFIRVDQYISGDLAISHP